MITIIVQFLMTIQLGVGVSTIVVKEEMEVPAAATLHRFKLQVIISPVSAQVNTIHGISNTQQVYCWGENWNYLAGIGTGSTSDVTTPALVNLGPSTQNGPQQYPLIHDRDPDNDGILSIFDDTPCS